MGLLVDLKNIKKRDKFQINEITNHNSQIPNKSQLPKFQTILDKAVWKKPGLLMIMSLFQNCNVLVIEIWCLVFVCYLVLAIWNFFAPKKTLTFSYFKKDSSIILTSNFRLRGPSNSQKKIPCQVPSTNRPFSMAISSDAPTRVDFKWAGEFPSRWR